MTTWSYNTMPCFAFANSCKASFSMSTCANKSNTSSCVIFADIVFAVSVFILLSTILLALRSYVFLFGLLIYLVVILLSPKNEMHA